MSSEYRLDGEEVEVDASKDLPKTLLRLLVQF